MIERIVDTSVKHRFVVVVCVLLVSALGVHAARHLPIGAVPDVTNVQVQVLTDAPGLGPEEVEQLITFPIESAMSGLPRLEEVRSLSRFGLSSVTLVFEEGTDNYFARQLVQERLAQARDAVPEELGNPVMAPTSSGLGEIYQFELRGEPRCQRTDSEDCFTLMELRTILDWYVAYQLRSIEGVVEVNSFGGELKTYEVVPDPSRLQAYEIGLSDLFEALDRNNVSAGGGYMAQGGEQRLVRLQGRLGGIDDIRQVVVKTEAEGTPVRLADVAEVRLAPMIRQGSVTRDGRGEVVTGIVMMLTGANPREVAHAVDQRIEQLRPTLPPGVTIDTYYDRTDLVNQTIRTAVVNLLEGGALVIVVLFLLLGHFRGGLLVASVIPLSMLGALIGMRAAGVSGNLMSLGAVDFGIIVDGAVVVVEHVLLTLALQKPPPEGAPQVVRAAARSVARPVFFAVAIIMLVYVPVFALSGIEGKMFRPMAITVLFALGTSVVLALTFVPALSAMLFRGGAGHRETWLMRVLRRGYEPVLDWSMRRPWLPPTFAMGAVLAALGAGSTLGAEFVPRLDEGAIAMQTVRLSSVSLEKSIELGTHVERVLKEQFPDEIDTVVTRTGRAEIAVDPMGVEVSDVYLMLSPPNQWKRARTKPQLIALIKSALEREVPGQNYLFSQPIELRTNELISGDRSDIAIHVYGDDLDELARIGEEATRVLSDIRGAADVSTQQVEGQPGIEVVVERQALARYGLSASDVGRAISAMSGEPVGEVFEGQRRFTLQVRLPLQARQDMASLADLPLATRGGVSIPLGQVAEIRQVEGPAVISRSNVQRRQTISVNLRGRDIASFVAEARRELSKGVSMPPGYFVEWGGQFENLREAAGRLALAGPAALALIFVLLYLTYGALRPTLIVYLNVPIAATGGVLALAVRGMDFSISAGVGFIALFGIAVLNGVVLVSTIRQLQHDGANLRDASCRAATLRLRPVLMTALTDAFGFLPMALSASAGAEVQRPLATVVIGGLVTSTLLTLFVLPAVYAKLGGEVGRTE